MPGEIISFVDEVFGPQQERLDRDCGDFILRRSDGIYAYQLAVAEDDGRMGVTRVVRDGTSSPPPPGRFGCWNSWATPSRPIAMFPCSKVPQGGACPNGTGIWTWAICGRIPPRKNWWGFWPISQGWIPRPTALRPSDLVPEFSWSKVGQADRIVDDGIWEAL